MIQLSGIVLSRDSVTGPLPGVHVYIPKAGRGDITNHMGYFSMPAQIRDSVVMSIVGYKRQHYIVPDNANEFQTIMVEMVEDTTYLRPVNVMAIPTEELFKQAVLALNISLDNEMMSRKNLNEELLALMLRTTPMDATLNYRNFTNEWNSTANNRYQPVNNPFLNPFNWARFIRDLRGTGKKKKKQ